MMMRNGSNISLKSQLIWIKKRSAANSNDKIFKSCKTQFWGIFDHFLAFYAQNEIFPNNSAVMQNPT